VSTTSGFGVTAAGPVWPCRVDSRAALGAEGRADDGRDVPIALENRATPGAVVSFARNIEPGKTEPSPPSRAWPGAKHSTRSNRRSSMSTHSSTVSASRVRVRASRAFGSQCRIRGKTRSVAPSAVISADGRSTSGVTTRSCATGSALSAERRGPARVYGVDRAAPDDAGAAQHTLQHVHPVRPAPATPAKRHR
jgi:hypothetical protein